MEAGIVGKVENDKIIKSFSGGRCPICALLRQDEFDLLCHWVGVSDEKYKTSKERNRLLESKGFCNYHFWEFERINTHYGSAEICIDFIEKLINALQEERGQNRFLGLLEYRRGLKCPLCADLATNESAYIKDLLSLLNFQKNRTKYAEGRGVCIPHLIQAAACVKDESLFSFLMEVQKKQLERIRIDAAGLLSKKDAPLRWEQTDDEKNSYFRSIEKLVGRRGLRNGR